MSGIEEGTFYSERLAFGKQVLIDCDPKIWQNIIWYSVLALHHENHWGEYYLCDDLYLKTYMEDAEWKLYDSSDEQLIRTDYVINIDMLWQYVEKQMTLFGISYESVVERMYGVESNTMGLREVVVEYMQFLTHTGYAMDLNLQRKNNVHEYNYKLVEMGPR